MKKPTKLDWQKQLLFSAIVIAIFIFAANSPGIAQEANQTYQIGDKVEVRWAGDEKWYKAVVKEIREGNSYLIVYEQDGNNAIYKPDRMRLIGGAKKVQEQPPPKTAENQPEMTGDAKNQPGAKFKPGNRVECDAAGIGDWLKGTVLPFEEKDNPDLDKDKTGKYFYIHRVRLDREASTRPAGGMCFTDRTRLLTGAAVAPPPVDDSVGKVTTDENNTLSADRPILECPVEQTKVKNGARPAAELLKKIVRCDKGEKPASKGYDGAVTVDVTALQVGTSRPWIYSQDIGGKPGTTIYLVRVTYTVKTFYRNRTTVDENWVRTINFYVNDFGEWQSGSEEPIKSPQSKDIPRLP